MAKSRSEELRWLLSKLHAEINSPETASTAVPGLAREYRTVLAELDEIAPAKKQTKGDELKAQREKRKREAQAQ